MQAQAIHESPPVTRKELWGWYLYDAASSAFAGVVVPVFFPLLLVVLAEGEAWKRMGQSPPEDCDDEHDIDCLMCIPGNGSVLIPGVEWTHMPKHDLQVLGTSLDPVSYASTVLGVSVLVQMVVFVTFGPLADYGGRRKKGLMVTTAVGGLTTCASLLLYTPWLWWLGGIFMLVANVAYGMAMIYFNAYLPVLVDATPSVREAAKYLPPKQAYLERERVGNEYSLTGIGIGYAAAVVVTAVSLAIAFIPGLDGLTTLRWIVFFGGAWWLLLSLFTRAWLLERPGPPPAEELPLLQGWTSLYDTIKDVQKYRYTFRFLLCYFVFSDGYTTISNVGILFGKHDICMTTLESVEMLMLVCIFASLGNVFFKYLQEIGGFSSKAMLVGLLVMLAMLPVYGMLGFFTPPDGLGMKHVWEMFVFGGYYGFCIGATTSYSRTIFAEVIPPGKEAAMFSLYAITDRGSSWTGPLVVAGVLQVTGELRLIMVYLLLVMIIPIYFLHYHFDYKQARTDAGRASYLKGTGDDDEELEERVASDNESLIVSRVKGRSKEGTELSDMG